MIPGKMIKDASIPKEKLALVAPTSGSDPGTKDYIDNAINAALFNQDIKGSLRVATFSNVTIASPGAAIDGVTLTAGNRVGLFGQSTASQNGLYVFNGAAVPMTRTTDADSNAEVTSQLVVSVEEGTYANKTFRLETPDPITLGTTALTFTLFSTLSSATPQTSNKDMAAVATVIDGDVACNTAIAGTPATDGYVEVNINGVQEVVGDGVKTKSCYFSADTGTTAKTIANIANGDKLYWNGSIAGYQLATDDLVTFNYNV